MTSSTDREIGYGTVYLDCSSGLPPILIGVPASWSGSSIVRVLVLPGVPYPDSRDHPNIFSHLGLSRSAFQCRLPVLTSVDVHLCSRSNSRLMLTTKRRMVEDSVAIWYWWGALKKANSEYPWCHSSVLQRACPDVRIQYRAPRSSSSSPSSGSTGPAIWGPHWKHIVLKYAILQFERPPSSPLNWSTGSAIEGQHRTYILFIYLIWLNVYRLPHRTVAF